MARGPKKHMKRVAAPSLWMLDKLSGVYAPKPSAGPHKLRECIPLILLLRNRLKYALTYNEVKLILMQRLVKVDGKVRTDPCYPCGLMDVITIEKTKQNFRMLYDTKGRFIPHAIRPEEATYKLCRIKKCFVGPKGVHVAVSHDGRTLRYIHPEIKANDTVRLEIATGKVLDFAKFDTGSMVLCTGGNNIGRVGLITHREKQPGTLEIVSVRDSKGRTYCTRINNLMIVGKGSQKWISLCKEEGVRKTNLDDRTERLSKMYGGTSSAVPKVSV